MRASLLLLALLGAAAGFKAVNWKAKFGDKKLVVITGTSSGLGRKTARSLLQTGK